MGCWSNDVEHGDRWSSRRQRWSRDWSRGRRNAHVGKWFQCQLWLRIDVAVDSRCAVVGRIRHNCIRHRQVWIW